MKIFKKYFYLFTGFASLVVYLFTIASSVIQIDSGELAAVQATLGIAHPTGYPLFTIIGYLFSLLPLPFTKIFQLNLLAAIYCAAVVSIFTFTISLVLKNWKEFVQQKKTKKEKQKGKKEKNISDEKPGSSFSEGLILIASVFGGLAFAFSKTFWFQSTSVEVYSLHLLLLSLIILFLIRAYLQPKADASNKLWYYFAIALALGFTNHMTTLLVLPGVAFLYFKKYGFNNASFKRIILMIGIFIPVLLIIYSYLPIRAAQTPIINWGNPIDLERIIRHISGKQYQVWLFSSMDAAKKQLVYFIGSMPTEFYLTLIISIIGAVYSFIKARTLFLFLIITFAATVLYSINYDIYDIDAYFLLAYFSAAFFASLGVVKLLSLKNVEQKITIVFITVVIVVQLYLNFGKVDQSGIYTFEDYTKELMNSVSDNAIIISYQWDFFVSASYYYQFVEDYRRDVTIVDKELLRRSWYYNQLNNYDPDLMKDLQDDINKFVIALKPFERDENFNANLLESLYRKIISEIILTNIDKRDIYFGSEMFDNEMRRGEYALPQGFSLVPETFLFKVVKSPNYAVAPDIDFAIRFPEKRHHYINSIENFIGSMMSRRILYESSFGYTDKAKDNFQKLKSKLPDYNIPASVVQAAEN